MPSPPLQYPIIYKTINIKRVRFTHGIPWKPLFKKNIRSYFSKYSKKINEPSRQGILEEQYYRDHREWSLRINNRTWVSHIPEWVIHVHGRHPRIVNIHAWQWLYRILFWFFYYFSLFFFYARSLNFILWLRGMLGFIFFWGSDLQREIFNAASLCPASLRFLQDQSI